MAAVGSHHVRGNLLKHPFPHKNTSNHSTPFLYIPNSSKNIPHKLLCSSMASTNPGLVSQPSDQVQISDQPTKDAIFTEKIDYWMQESVPEIVKNLKEAPLLVHIYSENDSVLEKGRMKVKTERACLDEWPMVKREWEKGESKSPDGLIFVEELEKDGEEDGDQDEGVARAWGIVVQRRGGECRPACYLLKTNRVCAGIGLGFCTHFCLMRVKNFRDSALDQFRDSWLLQ